MTDTDGVLLVLGSGHQQFREYLLASAAQRGKVWLFDPEAPTWQTPYIVGSTVLDVFDPAVSVPAARELAAHTPVRGVYCYHEAGILAAAHVAAELGVPGPTPEAVAAVRDKGATRDVLARAGIRQPEVARVTTEEEAEKAAARIGFPLVAKPRGLGASQGVVKVSAREDLAEALKIAGSATQAGMVNHADVLVEEFLTGPEISVDAAVFDGEYLPYLIGHKQLGGEPYFEETGHTVIADDPLFADEDLWKMLAEAHQALGWSHGMTHTEVKLTPDGPVIVEVNGRLGGDLIPYLGRIANGIDSGQVQADVTLGVRPRLDRSRNATVAIRFLCPPASCTVRRLAMPAADPDAGLYESVPLVEPGTRLLMPPEGYIARYGYLIARASSPEECEAVLDRAEADVVFEGEC
ncbi:ATP-grasp domain-containing protein [Streptomyces sp. SD31]|uniref:ATP-grasp domain-containing protein n=1 Tax=Streptomyces sp. SD31 TaxID=3452208 RepID=UPI003F8A4DE1